MKKRKSELKKSLTARDIFTCLVDNTEKHVTYVCQLHTCYQHIKIDDVGVNNSFFSALRTIARMNLKKHGTP